MKESFLYIQRLEKKQIKPTAVRILVLRTLMEAPCAVSLSELERLLETVDKSSIFRTLNLFLAHHLVHEMEDGSGSSKYEVCESEDICSIDDMHVHFYCTRCHRTYCFKHTPIPLITLPEGFRMQSINYMVKGLCDECSLKETDPTVG